MLYLYCIFRYQSAMTSFWDKNQSSKTKDNKMEKINDLLRKKDEEWQIKNYLWLINQQKLFKEMLLDAF